LNFVSGEYGLLALLFLSLRRFYGEHIVRCFDMSMTIIELGLFALIGFISGIVLSVLDPGRSSEGVFTSVLLGIFASLIAAFLSIQFAPPHLQEPLSMLTIAALASLIVVAAQRLLFRKKGFIRTQMSDEEI